MTNFSPENLQKLLPEGADIPHLSHITGSFRQFTLYAPSIKHSVVFAGDATTDDATPTLIGLNNVVDVARGDYHALALTRDGEVRAWGSQKGGKLGVPSLNYNRDADITEPLPVSFTSDRRTFAFTIAAAGWHSAALVIDLDGDDEECEGEKEEKREEQRECHGLFDCRRSFTNSRTTDFRSTSSNVSTAYDWYEGWDDTKMILV